MKSGGVRRVLGEVLGSALMLVVLCAGWVVAPSASAQGAAPAQKVFRYAFPVAETGFDPVQISGNSSPILRLSQSRWSPALTMKSPLPPGTSSTVAPGKARSISAANLAAFGL